MNFLTAYFLFGKMLRLLWQICNFIGLIFILANGQILKNNLTIWSHCKRLFRAFLHLKENEREPKVLTSKTFPAKTRNSISTFEAKKIVSSFYILPFAHLKRCVHAECCDLRRTKCDLSLCNCCIG